MTETNIDVSGLTEARNFIVQYLRDSGYVGSVEDGSAIHDAVVKPMALLLSIFRSEIAKSKAYLSLEQATKDKVNLGDEYDDVVDAILSNWFVSRKDGVPARVRVRLFFTQAPMIVKLTTSRTIMTADGIPFGPAEDITIYNTDMTAHLNPFGGTEKYSFDLTLEARSVGTITSDLILANPSFSPNITFFLSGTVLSVINDGTLKEDTDEFIQRTKKVITTRELISDRAIATVLPEEVPEVRDTYIAGFGSAEQLRDIHTFAGVTLHTGNKTDIYVQTEINRVQQTFTLASGNTLDLSNTGVLRIFSVKNSLTNEVEFTILGSTESLVNSLRDSFFMHVPSGVIGDVYTVDYLQASALVAPTDFIEHPDNRVGCYDPLVKEMFPVVIRGTLYVHLDEDTLAANDTTNVLAAVTSTAVNFITALGSSDVFRVSALVSAIHAAHSEVLEIITPVYCYYEIVNPADMSIRTGQVVSMFQLPVGLSAQVTNNTTQYYTDSDLFTISLAG